MSNEKYRENYDRIFCPHAETFERQYSEFVIQVVCTRCNKVIRSLRAPNDKSEV